ncbi:MAG: hypothetical protein AAGJ18_17685, partial [Bacteroidota bacterium]
MKVIGYQTLEDRDNVDEVETMGPYKCDRRGAWLGHGYYFWDTNREWAHDWGRNSYERRKLNYIIGQAVIKIDEKIFDLFGNVGHQQDFKEACELITNDSKWNKNKQLTVGMVLQFLKNKGFFDYNGIRANDYPKNVIRVNFAANKGEHTLI